MIRIWRARLLRWPPPNVSGRGCLRPTKAPRASSARAAPEGDGTVELGPLFVPRPGDGRGYGLGDANAALPAYIGERKTRKWTPALTALCHGAYRCSAPVTRSEHRSRPASGDTKAQASPRWKMHFCYGITSFCVVYMLMFRLHMVVLIIMK